MNIASEPDVGGANSLPVSSFPLPADFKLTRTLIVRVIKAGGVMWEGAAESITLPSHDGEMGILRGHIAVTTFLTLGLLRIRANGQSLSIFVVGGWAQVEGDEVLVRAMGAERGDEIDFQQAQADLEAAKEVLKQAQSQGERLRADNAVKKAQARLKAAQSFSSTQARQPTPVAESGAGREFFPTQFPQEKQKGQEAISPARPLGKVADRLFRRGGPQPVLES